VDYSSKRLPARVGGYPEGVRFPARKEELLGRLGRNGVPGSPRLLGQLREGPPKASAADRRTSCRPCDGGVSRETPTGVGCLVPSRGLTSHKGPRIRSARSTHRPGNPQIGEGRAEQTADT
jgi:hypothetical protein